MERNITGETSTRASVVLFLSRILYKRALLICIARALPGVKNWPKLGERDKKRRCARDRVTETFAFVSLVMENFHKFSADICGDDGRLASRSSTFSPTSHHKITKGA